VSPEHLKAAPVDPSDHKCITGGLFFSLLVCILFFFVCCFESKRYSNDMHPVTSSDEQPKVVVVQRRSTDPSSRVRSRGRAIDEIARACGTVSGPATSRLEPSTSRRTIHCPKRRRECRAPRISLWQLRTNPTSWGARSAARARGRLRRGQRSRRDWWCRRRREIHQDLVLRRPPDRRCRSPRSPPEIESAPDDSRYTSGPRSVPHREGLASRVGVAGGAPMRTDPTRRSGRCLSCGACARHKPTRRDRHARGDERSRRPGCYSEPWLEASKCACVTQSPRLARPVSRFRAPTRSPGVVAAPPPEATYSPGSRLP
jgi:hypothetical protein